MIGILFVVCLAVGFQDIIQGFILTAIYPPISYADAAVQLEMANIIRYTVTAFVVTIFLMRAIFINKRIQKMKE